MKPALARLERVSLRAAWKHEAGEFTPWLAQDENLQRLAEALDLPELNLDAIEHAVGDFRVDILCSDETGPVIIENQLDRTNHAHLGQILTYAAGVGAKKVVWVAESFRPEHIAALEFLNQNTTEDLDFFAVAIELWRIADSPLAPSFKVVVKPNDWSKAGRESARAAASTTPGGQRRLAFWSALVAHIEAQKAPLKPQKPSARHWLTCATVGRSGLTITAAVNTREQRLTAELYIHNPPAKAIFHALHAQREAIENELGFALDWQELPDSDACRICVARPASDLADESAWPMYFTWLTDKLTRLAAAFRPRVKDL